MIPLPSSDPWDEKDLIGNPPLPTFVEAVGPAGRGLDCCRHGRNQWERRPLVARLPAVRTALPAPAPAVPKGLLLNRVGACVGPFWRGEPVRSERRPPSRLSACSREAGSALVALLLFQVGSGVYLATHSDVRPNDRFRTFRIASGIFLATYLLGHMNSAFVLRGSISAST